jgi:hypothetical protein
MFASNQILAISGCLSHDGDLKNALEFAMKAHGLDVFVRTKNPAKCVYQVTEDGRYCIGWAFNNIKEGWNEYPFDFDLDIISRIIAKHLEKQELERDIWDGSYHKGFVMSGIPESMASETDGIKNPFYGIVC